MYNYIIIYVGTIHFSKHRFTPRSARVRDHGCPLWWWWWWRRRRRRRRRASSPVGNSGKVSDHPNYIFFSALIILGNQCNILILYTSQARTLTFQNFCLYRCYLSLHVLQKKQNSQKSVPKYIYYIKVTIQDPFEFFLFLPHSPSPWQLNSSTVTPPLQPWASAPAP